MQTDALLVILGPTASGKTRLAANVAHRLGAEIISADSRQVYRQMDIGTGKDLNEYEIEGRKIPYHLIDIVDAGAQYNVNDFQHDFRKVQDEIIRRGNIPLLCGGTGFYIHSLLMGHAYSAIPVDEQFRKEAETLDADELLRRFNAYQTSYRHLADTSTRKRLIRAIEISEYLLKNPDSNLFSDKPEVRPPAILFGLNPPVEVRRERISKRLKTRLENGMIEEVQALLTRLAPEQLIYYGLEYKYITLYLTGELSYQTMAERLETEIHRFAKRQMTFFRKMEKDGLLIHWLEDEWTEEEKTAFVTAKYQEFRLN